MLFESISERSLFHSFGLHAVNHGLDVLFGTEHILECGHNAVFAIEQVGDALVHADEWDCGIVLLGHLARAVRQQFERQFVGGLELKVRGYVVAADAQHGDVQVAEFGKLVAELAGLLGAARREILGVEINDARLAMLVQGKRERFAGSGRQ